MRRRVTCLRSARTSWPAYASSTTGSYGRRSTIAGNSCERRGIARRRTEPGWRAAVLDERAKRVRKAAATERQPQRAERAIQNEESGGAFPLRATTTAVDSERDARAAKCTRAGRLTAVLRDRAEAVGSRGGRPISLVGFPRIQRRHVWRGGELFLDAFLGSRPGCAEGRRKAGVVFQEAQQFDGEGQYQGRVLLGGHLDNRLQQPQLQRARCVGHGGSCVRQPVGGLQLALGR